MAEAVKTECKTTKNDRTANLLRAVYKNVKMASDSILNLMPKVENASLKSDMTVQLSVYEGFASRAAKHLGDEGIKPEEEGAIAKVSSKMGMMMNTMRDSSTTHLVEMLIEGATMGVNDLLKEIRESENTDASEASLRLARDVCRFEEKTITELKDRYLRT